MPEGVYTVEIDETNKKDEEYINTNITYSFSGGKVKGTYGTNLQVKRLQTHYIQKQINLMVIYLLVKT